MTPGIPRAFDHEGIAIAGGALPIIAGAEVPAFLEAMHQMAHEVQAQDDFPAVFGQATKGQLQDGVTHPHWIVAELTVVQATSR
jgi:hypothetical protein